MYLIWPIILIVLSNTFYNICAKSTPAGVNPFASLLITYLTAAAATLILLFFYSPEKNITTAFKSINWTSFCLGICIIGLEFGYIMAYRAGWNISIGSLVANVLLAVILIFVGLLFFKEKININHLIGIVLCIIGLIFINRK
jgi:drug/metabolite transporter (DMT)-like permease